MSKHTPGKWMVLNDIVCAEAEPGVPDFDRVIAEIKKGGMSGLHAYNNAKLIAAAPRMLRDLKSLLSIIEMHAQISRRGIEAQDVVARARLTVKVAEGGDHE